MSQDLNTVFEKLAINHSDQKSNLTTVLQLLTRGIKVCVVLNEKDAIAHYQEAAKEMARVVQLIKVVKQDKQNKQDKQSKQDKQDKQNKQPAEQPNQDKQNKQSVEQDSCDIQSDLIIITGIANNQYRKYFDQVRKHGFVCLVFDASIVSASMYIGIFFSKKEIIEWLTQEQKSNASFAVLEQKSNGSGTDWITQKTPLHVTCWYIGGNAKLKEQTHDTLTKNNGTLIDATIIGISINDAGIALVVDDQSIIEQLKPTNDKPIFTEDKILHITCHTNEKFSPVQVGQKINRDDVISCKYVIRGVLSHTY